MTETYTPPSSIDGIRRLAKRLKREHGVIYTTALERAAGIAGYSNFKHALRQIPALEGDVGSWSVPTYLTAYWIDPKIQRSGRETLSVLLPAPWATYISSREFRYLRALRQLKRLADDHLQIDAVLRSQDGARNALGTAARTFLFMAASGLRPATSHRAYEAFHADAAKRFPGEDHSSFWREGLSDRWVMVDEPYGLAVDDKEAARKFWANRNGCQLVKSGWSGMYSPGSAYLFLLADIDKGPDLSGIAATVAKLPIEDGSTPWMGEFGPYRPIWQSPAQRAAAKPRLAPAPRNDLLPSRRRNNSIGYGGYLVHRGARRPDARMPIEAHQEVGQLLKDALAVSWKRAGAHGRINSVRCRLDDWVQGEFNRSQLPDDVFSELYYHGHRPDLDREPTQQEKLSCIDKLLCVAQLLLQHYPDSAPRTELLSKLALANKSLTGWSSRRSRSAAA